MTIQLNWDQIQPQHKWTILKKQKRFAFWALFGSLGGVMFGFDNAISGTATAMAAFQKEFGAPWPDEPSGYVIPASYQASWTGAASGGVTLGVLIAGQLIERIGRKRVMGAGSVLSALGVSLQVAAHGWKLFLAGRFFSALGYGAIFLLSPVWIGEIVRPELRGFFLCLMNGSMVVGQLFLACVARGSSTIVGRWSYETMIVMQFLFVAVLLAVYPWYPESPYYLIKRGDYDLARISLARIHGSDDQALIDAEMRRMGKDVAFSQAIRVDAEQSGPLLRQCFQGTNLRRTMIACLPSLAQQLIGAAFVLGFVTYFISLLKLEHYFTISLVLYIVMLLSNLSAFFLIEVVGRRVLLVPGMFVLTLTLLIMGIMGCIGTTAATWVVLVCIFFWSIAYQVTTGAIGFALGSEIASLPLRASTQSLLAFTQNVTGWLVGFVTPYMINPDAAHLGAKVGFVFAGFGVPLCVLYYFFIPETKGLTFEEIDALFLQKTSCRHFQSTAARLREQSDEPGVVEDARAVSAGSNKAFDQGQAEFDDSPEEVGRGSQSIR